MQTQSITISLPGPLFEEYRERALQTQRTVEDELLSVIASASLRELPRDHAQALSELELLKDEDLRNAMNTQLPEQISADIETLHLKKQREGLSEHESATLATLMNHYERTMLIRAKAATLLKERGYSIPQPNLNSSSHSSPNSSADS